MREIMDCLSATNPIQDVIFMAGAQIGKSEAGNNWVGYVIDYAPGPMLLVEPTVDNAKRYSKQRITPMVLESPPSNLYYDVWAHRRNGVQFTKQPPYHAELPLVADWLLEMDSIGSIIAMRGDVARAVYVPMEDVLVGTCRMIRELGHKIWLDTGAKCLHP